MHGTDDVFEKMDPRRLKEKTGSNNDCFTHECGHCRILMKFEWRVKGTLNLNLEEDHVARVARHLENHCDEEGSLSIQQRLIKN